MFDTCNISSLLSDASEDEGFNSPFATLQRHSSFNMDPETPEEEKGAFHMHRLRSVISTFEYFL